MSEHMSVTPLPPLSEEYCWADHAIFPAERGVFSRLPGVSSLCFSIEMLRAVFSSAQAFKRGRRSKREIFWRSSRLEQQVVGRYGGEIEATGLHHLKSLAGRPCVIIGNHMSMIETFVLPMLTLPWLDTTFVVKESLMRAPSMGTILKAVGAIAVGRTNPREDFKVVQEEGVRLLNEGRSIIIFPQSTRSVNFDPASFSSIGTKLARSANVPVVPLALRTDFLLNGKIVKELGSINPARPPIKFAFDAPITVEGNGKAAQEAVLTFIRSKMIEWGVPIVGEES